MRRSTALGVAAAALVSLGLAGALAWLVADRASHAGVYATGGGWTETAWPFAMDQWGKGKAFHCKASACGTDVTLYVRAKIGFCNCATGVADDEELERISDLDLIGTGVSHAGDGRPISVAWMKGRSRAYTAAAARAGTSGLSIGFNDRCDAIVATAVLKGGSPAAVEPAVLDFLNSKPVLRWAEVTLGL
jgi:hypothetical protein